MVHTDHDKVDKHLSRLHLLLAALEMLSSHTAITIAVMNAGRAHCRRRHLHVCGNPDRDLQFCLPGGQPLRPGAKGVSDGHVVAFILCRVVQEFRRDVRN